MSSDSALDTDRWFKRLTVGGRRVNFVYDVHSFDHAPEGGKALAIRISFAAEIQFRLIAYADKKVVRRCIRAIRTIEIDPSR